MKIHTSCLNSLYIFIRGKYIFFVEDFHIIKDSSLSLLFWCFGILVFASLPGGFVEYLFLVL